MTSVSAQAKAGLKTVGNWLLGISWLALVFVGLGIAFTPSRFPVAGGWALLAAAAAILVMTANKWVKALPGILGIATLNSIVMIATGHATGAPSVRVTHLQAAYAAILLGSGTVISLSFPNRELRILDRVAFLIYAICLAWGGVEPRTTYWALGVATAILFAAWSYDRFRSGQGRFQTGS